MDGALDGQLEQRLTGNIISVVPLIDTYLHEIGNNMKNKMGRGRGTSLQSSVPLLVQWQAMVYIIHLSRGYGAVITLKTKNSNKVRTVTVSSEQCGRMLWHPMRTGSNHLAKRQFSTVPVPEENGKKKKQKTIYHQENPNIHHI